MVTASLSVRSRDVLQCIISEFVVTGDPVGSQRIAEKSGLGLSPATIRNTMVDLEEKGYLHRPHASAGRIPTDKGYRLYVDDIMKRTRLSTAEKQTIESELRQEESRDVQEFLDHTARVLGTVCRQLGIALAPRFYQGIFRRLELIPLSETQVLLVLMITSGLVRTVVAQVDSHIPQPDLVETARILNERLYGLTLQEIRDSLQERIKDKRQVDAKVVRLFSESADYLFEFDHDQVYMGGTTNIAAQPEFNDHNKLLTLIQFLDNRKSLAELFKIWAAKGNEPRIVIGSENPWGALQTCSVVTCPYFVGDLHGILGIIGPTRMHYSRLTSIVSYTARLLNEVFA